MFWKISGPLYAGNFHIGGNSGGGIQPPIRENFFHEEKNRGSHLEGNISENEKISKIKYPISKQGVSSQNHWRKGWIFISENKYPKLSTRELAGKSSNLTLERIDFDIKKKFPI